jgi:LCP family protein required for cell wall assembly
VNQDLRHNSRRAAKTPSIARHGRLKRNGPWATVAKVAASVVAITLISGSAVAAYAAWDLASTVQPTVTLGNEAVLEGVPDVGAMEGGVNLLVVGSDSRQGQGEAFGDPDEETAVLNDVTMLMHISEDHSNASVVSFPRDMLVDVPECTDPEDPAGDPLYELYDVKINSVLSHGGLGCVVKTVETELGITIPFAGIVQFMGVAGLSEAVGGVEVCVAEPIEDEYTGTFLEAGTHTLSGVAALQFLRTRHGVGDGSDLARISNQQVFLSSLARTLQSNGTLGDPVKLYSIAKAALANMQLSDSLMDPTRMISIAKALKDTDLNKIAFIQYPTAYVEGGGAVAPTDSAEYVRTALQTDMPVTFDPAAQEAAFASAGDPNAVAAPPAEEVPAEGAPADAATAPTAEALPSDVAGQTAAETRCSAGRTLGDQ